MASKECKCGKIMDVPEYMKYNENVICRDCFGMYPQQDGHANWRDQTSTNGSAPRGGSRGLYSKSGTYY